MTTEEQITTLQNAVAELSVAVRVSQKTVAEAEARCQDLQARWDQACKQGFPGSRSEGIGLGRRGGNLVAHFDGNLKHYPNFRADVLYALHLLRKDFKDEEEKVGFIVSHLHGEARTWLRNLWREDGLARRDSDEFIKAMDACFQSTVDVDVARQEMHGLRQGKATVRQYHSRFFALLNVLGWEKDSLAVRDLFWEGLHGSVKDELARGDRPQTLADVVQRALTIGVRHEERPWHSEEGRHVRPPARAPPFLPRDLGRTNPSPMLKGGEEPMELGRAKAQSAAGASASGAVKAKPPRGTRKCYICDSAQHMAKECPQRLQKHTAALATVTGEAFQGEQFQGNENAWLEAEMLGLRQASQ